ncbi:MAG: hypothetical protein HWD58_10435 [Bacteroidota bacterium]|nr:MAG: hypothetical protein HWD58_10435 [Bacteroidota bacterium]
MPPVPGACPNAIGFTGAFDPTNWTLSNTNGGNGSVSSNSSTVLLTGSNAGSLSPTYTYYTVTVPCDGVINFNWDYSTTDWDRLYDPFGYSINGVLRN